MDSIVQFLIDWGYIGLFISALLAGSILHFVCIFVYII